MSFSTVHYLIRYNCLCCCRSVPKSCPTLCNPMACSPPGSSAHGMSKQEYWSWVIISFSKDHYFENKKHKTPVQSNTKCSSSWHALAKPNGWSYLLLHVLHRVAGLIKIKMESPSHLTGCECCLMIVRKVVTLQGHRTEGQATVVWRPEREVSGCSLVFMDHESLDMGYSSDFTCSVPLSYCIFQKRIVPLFGEKWVVESLSLMVRNLAVQLWIRLRGLLSRFWSPHAFCQWSSNRSWNQNRWRAY